MKTKKINNKKKQKKIQFYVPTLYIWLATGVLTIIAVFLGVQTFHSSYTPSIPSEDDYYTQLRKDSNGFDAKLLQSIINEETE